LNGRENRFIIKVSSLCVNGNVFKQKLQGLFVPNLFSLRTAADWQKFVKQWRAPHAGNKTNVANFK